MRYRIRIFDGQLIDGAPREVWIEALNWMDIQAMASGTMLRDPYASGRLSTAGSPRPATSSPKIIGWPRFANTNRWCVISAI